MLETLAIFLFLFYECTILQGVVNSCNLLGVKINYFWGD